MESTESMHVTGHQTPHVPLTAKKEGEGRRWREESAYRL
jgi:hypothetical protein